jgi:expansin (peptidoglycan-binding protein)
VTKTARGAFEVTMAPEGDDSGIGRFSLTKTWSGDLAATGHGHMLSAGDPTGGDAGYVALEVVEGTLHGRAGSLAFQQLGVMHDGDQHLDYRVVPGSGTGDLVGITGTLALTIDERGHSYELTYTLG